MYIMFFITTTVTFVAITLIYKGELILGCSGFTEFRNFKCTLVYIFPQIWCKTRLFPPIRREFPLQYWDPRETLKRSVVPLQCSADEIPNRFFDSQCFYWDRIFDPSSLYWEKFTNGFSKPSTVLDLRESIKVSRASTVLDLRESNSPLQLKFTIGWIFRFSVFLLGSNFQTKQGCLDDPPTPKFSIGAITTGLWLQWWKRAEFLRFQGLQSLFDSHLQKWWSITHCNWRNCE